MDDRLPSCRRGVIASRCCAGSQSAGIGGVWRGIDALLGSEIRRVQGRVQGRRAPCGAVARIRAASARGIRHESLRNQQHS